MLWLQGYRWPGNVRELENVLERAAIVCGGYTISRQHLPADMQSQNDGGLSVIATNHSINHARNQTTNQTTNQPQETLSLPDAVQTLEIRLITQALEQVNNNKSRAAKLLQISERTLWYKLSRYHLTDVKLD